MKNWVIKKLGEAYVIRNGTHDSPKYDNRGFQLVTSKNLTNHKLTFDDINSYRKQIISILTKEVKSMLEMFFLG